MADNGNRKSGEVRLVKVNSKEKTSKRYDAYGYEIPEEKPPVRETASEPDYRVEETGAARRTARGTEADAGTGTSSGTGITAPGHRYDADIRAAIESGAHRRTRSDEPQTGSPSAVRETSTDTAGRSSGSGRSGNSHVSNRNRYDEEEQAERQREIAAQNREKVQNNNKKQSKKQKKLKKLQQKQQKQKKAQEEAAKKAAEKEAAEKQAAEKRAEEEKRPLTAHEKRKKILRAKRRRTIGNIFKVVAVVLVIALIIVLITVNSKKGSGINTQFVSMGYVEDAAYGDLSFLRVETPVYSSFSGVFMPCVNEGDRVSKNAVIGHVIKAEYSDALKELKEVESRIAAAQKATTYVDAGKTGEMLALENGIDGEIEAAAKLAMSGGLSGYHDIFSRLSDLFSRKNELEMSADSADTYISGLQKERNSILNKISSSMHEIHANASGIVSFRCDGNEGRVTEASNSLESRIENTNFLSVQSSTLTTAELGAITLPEGDLKVSSGMSVSNGTTVARIATENSYYITIPVNDYSSHHISSGAAAEIYVQEDNLRFEAKIVGIYYCGDEALAVLKASRALDGTVSLRKEAGRVVFTHVEGLKVPLRVLSDWDSAGVTARLTILRSGYIRYAYVNVLGRDNDYAIINSRSTLDDGTGISVRENDEYVVNYDKFYEGQGI